MCIGQGGKFLLMRLELIQGCQVKGESFLEDSHQLLTGDEHSLLSEQEQAHDFSGLFVWPLAVYRCTLFFSCLQYICHEAHMHT